MVAFAVVRLAVMLIAGAGIAQCNESLSIDSRPSMRSNSTIAREYHDGSVSVVSANRRSLLIDRTQDTRCRVKRDLALPPIKYTLDLDHDDGKQKYPDRGFELPSNYVCPPKETGVLPSSGRANAKSAYVTLATRARFLRAVYGWAASVKASGTKHEV